MLRHSIGSLFFIIWAVMITVPVAADVTGAFEINFILTPEVEAAQTEAVKFLIEPQTTLQVDFTLSGMTFGTTLDFNNQGVQQAVLELDALLGALMFNVELTFGQDNPPGNVQFVSKKVTTAWNLGGFTFENLAIYEDTSFNNITAPQTPAYQFGNLLTIEGQTTSGLRVTSMFSLCVERGRVTCEDIQTPSGGVLPNELLRFSFYETRVSDIELGGITWDIDMRYQADEPFELGISTQTDLLGFATLFTDLAFIDALRLDSAFIFADLGVGRLSVLLDENLDIFSASFTHQVRFDETTLRFRWGVDPLGLDSLTASLSTRLDDIRFLASARYRRPEDTDPFILFDTATFSLSYSVNALSIEISTQIDADGLNDFELQTGFDF